MRTKEQVFGELTDLIQETFVAPDTKISRDTVADDIPGWDSTSHVVLLLTIEDHFGIRQDPDDNFANVGEMADDIYERLTKAQG